jgi:alanyl-tRNA synthetase
MKTERLYYQDPYLREFTATVTDCVQKKDAYILTLDQSAFYPTSGGQPHDEGTLDDGVTVAKVSDVFVKDDVIYHQADRPIKIGALVTGRIDWERRFDHMQQHGGEHLLAGSAFHLFGGVTHGLHVGLEESTIDITMPDGRTRLEKDEIICLENLVNERIQSNSPIRCWFPSEEELKSLPLRKPSTISQDVRVVAAGDFEMVPCGGTHPQSTGELGLLKILSTAPAHEKMRISFVVGKRAIDYFQRTLSSLDLTAQMLSSHMTEVPDAVARLQNQLKEKSLAEKKLKEELAGHLLEEAKQKATRLNGCQLIFFQLQSDEILQKIIAEQVLKSSGLVAIVSREEENGQYPLYVCSEDVKLDMVALLRASGVRGGGRSEYASGRAEKEADLLLKASSILKEQQSKKASTC